MLPKKTEGIDGHMYHVLGEVAIFHGQDLLAVEKKKKRSVMQETDGGNFSLPPPRSFKDRVRESGEGGALFVFSIGDPKQNVNSFMTPVSDSVFNALSHGSSGFVPHGSPIIRHCKDSYWLLKNFDQSENG